MNTSQWHRLRPIYVAPAVVAVLVGILVVALLPRSSPATRACTAADITAESNLDGATGSLAGGIVITNTGAASCVLSGPPARVELRAGGDVLDVAPTLYRSLLADDPRAAPPVLLKPGERARSFVLWSNWCAGSIAELELLVVLPNGSGPISTTPEPSAAPPTTPRCDVPGARSSLGVFAFAPFAR